MAEPLKNEFDAPLVKLLAEKLEASAPGFDTERFSHELLQGFPDLELKGRINLVADVLAQLLPASYPEALAVIVAVAESGVNGFAAWPLCSFVERHGIAHPEQSLAAMETLTRHWSCEFAIRPFLDGELDLTISYLRRWVHNDDEAVRRLVSEGTRPRLPWGPRVRSLLEDPAIGIELISELRHDPSSIVRRSVANHLNDVSRADPDLVVAVIGQWAEEPRTDPAMIRHGLRSLVKAGDPGALQILGFTTDAEVEIDHFSISPKAISLGSDIEMAATVRSTSDSEQKLVIDFVVHHITATGGLSPKVFKWTTVSIDSDQIATLSKKRRIQTASTRRYNAGIHRVDLQVAGQVVASTEFLLNDSSERNAQ